MQDHAFLVTMTMKGFLYKDTVQQKECANGNSTAEFEENSGKICSHGFLLKLESFTFLKLLFHTLRMMPEL